MKIESEFPSFKEFKSKLFKELGNFDFYSSGDIAIKNIETNLTAQVIVAGNDYYLALTLQISMPKSASELERIMKSTGRSKRLHSGKVYSPIFSVNFIGIVDDVEINSAIEKANWKELCRMSSAIATKISLIYEGIKEWNFISKDFWWPDRFGDDQANMIVIAAVQLKREDLLEFLVYRYDLSQVKAILAGGYEAFISHIVRQSSSSATSH